MPSKADPVVFADDHGVYGVPGDVSPWDVRHDPADRAFLDRDPSGAVRWRVWTEPTLTDAMVVVRVDGRTVGHPMREVAGTPRFTFWELVAGPWAEAEVEYSFAFRGPRQNPVYAAPSGITNAIERLDRWEIGELPAAETPEWAQGAVIYQIFPDRYDRAGTGAPALESAGPALDTWGSLPTPNGFQGGDLAGVESRLDHLQHLGVDAIYLTPIFTSPSNHRYDTVDYYNVDPLLGGNEALASLVDAAHRRSIRVILDASFNHVHPEFFAFKDLVERGSESEYWDWFNVTEWPLRIRHRPGAKHPIVDHESLVPRWRRDLGFSIELVEGPGPPVEPSYDAWYGVPTMPRVDLTNPEAKAYMLDVAAHWPREYGIDGWRMDVTRYVDPDFWSDFRRAVRSVRSDVLLISEVVGDASPWLQGDRFDSTMNYTFRQLSERFFATEEIDGRSFLEHTSRLWAQYSWPTTLVNHNLLGSHDTPRFLTVAGGDRWRLELATVFQMTFPGAPGIYYGDEFEMTGGDDPGSRGAVDWGRIDTPLARSIAELAELRRKERALAVGDFRAVAGTEDLIVFERSLAPRRLTVAINRGEGPSGLRIGNGPLSILWGEAGTDGPDLVVPARSAVILAS